MQQVSRQPAKDTGSRSWSLGHRWRRRMLGVSGRQANAEAAHPAAAMTGGFMKNWHHDA